MAKIETVYKATIWYEAESHIVDAIEGKAFDWEIDGLSVETMGGNAACSPYIEVMGDTLSKVETFVGKMERYIKRRKGAQLL